MKNRIITVRLTQDEFAMLRSVAGGRTISATIVKLIEQAYNHDRDETNQLINSIKKATQLAEKHEAYLSRILGEVTYLRLLLEEYLKEHLRSDTYGRIINNALTKLKGLEGKNDREGS